MAHLPHTDTSLRTAGEELAAASREDAHRSVREPAVT
ncbi:hypothetical protein FHX81_3049 [Saccharothrix saharensis]|uniref:Uncharacterized protein n=1 Tax=Saccharothrix saharensis TaxID=571190 RepID=A0A543JD50_9PSEU|nr:hypothetical protein FHX81_3049 [Saccharothrix saharensis]